MSQFLPEAEGIRTSVSFGRCHIGISEKHNQRLMPVPDAREDLRHLNSEWVLMSIRQCLDREKSLSDTTRTSPCRKSVNMIREAVAVIREDTTIEQMVSFGQKVGQMTGFRLIQAYLHKDEGHYDPIDRTLWKPNYHAHLVFATVSRRHGIGKDNEDSYGSVISPPRDFFFAAQDLVAEATGMLRGIPSDRKHLSVMRLKNERAIQENIRLQQAISEGRQQLEMIRQESDTLRQQADRTLESAAESVGALALKTLDSPLVRNDSRKERIRQQIGSARTQPAQTKLETSISAAGMSTDLLLEGAKRAKAEIETRAGELSTRAIISDTISRISGAVGLSPSVTELKRENRALRHELAESGRRIESLKKDAIGLRRTISEERSDRSRIEKRLSVQEEKLARVSEMLSGLPDDFRDMLDFNGLEDYLGIRIPDELCRKKEEISQGHRR